MEDDVTVFNLLDGEVEPADEIDGFHHGRARIRGELLAASLYEVPPGQRLWPYHFHHGNEEWLVVVSGRPTVRAPDGERVLRPGDLVGFPEGGAGAHTLANATDEPVRVAVFSTLRYGTSVYPDSDKLGVTGRYFRRGDAVDYWDGEA